MAAENSTGDISETALSFKQFLETVPPGERRIVTETTAADSVVLQTPAIQLHCDSDDCGGIRFFDRTGNSRSLDFQHWSHAFLTYRCRHCGITSKTYAISVHLKELAGPAEALKFGEWPVFAPHVPARLLSLVGDDQALFRKGRRSEANGLGIAAFAYYRRVVENQKTRLIDEVIKVAKRTRAKTEVITALTDAAGETRFSSAIDKIKDAMPEVLRINGHNPMTLLHDLLSDGLHAQTDEECLNYATDIRVLLSDLCQKISVALKDQTEVETAVSRLLARQRQARTALKENDSDIQDTAINSAQSATGS